MATVSLFPDTSGDVIVKPEGHDDGSSVDMVIVDEHGAPKSPGLCKPAALVAGGGTVQLETYITDAGIGIQTDPTTQHPTVAEV
jgi:hypothetical protein